MKQLLKKIGWTLGLSLVYLALSYLPVPFLESRVLNRPGDFSFLDGLQLFHGGPFQKVTFMGTGISAYITAGILVQFVMYLNQSLYIRVKLPGGEQVVKQWTLYAGLILAAIISSAQLISLALRFPIFLISPWLAVPFVILFQVLGTYVAIRIGFLIDDHGIGQGMSVLIGLNILKMLPLTLVRLKGQLVPLIGFLVITLMVMVALIVIETSEYKVPVHYAKSYLKGFKEANDWGFKLNPNGVMPLIMASLVLGFIPLRSPWLVTFLLVILVVLFNYLYSFMTFDALELNQQLQSQAGQIEGVRPGLDTQAYLEGMNRQLTRLSSGVLAGVICLSYLVMRLTGIKGVSFSSLMILIGVWIQLILEVRSSWYLIRIKQSDVQKG